ncbi:MAG: long-chain fatty acid--CoA ligase [Comamonadaceae bacterium]|nr:long-chain fatty acid--CoA ligase [Comamonadaceae bacterium]
MRPDRRRHPRRGARLARAHACRPACSIVCLAESGETGISYWGSEAAGRRRWRAGLQREGLEPRQTVAIMLPTSPEYFHTYFGILRAGGIPVPIYPPARLMCCRFRL